MNRLISLSGSFSVHILKYISVVFFYTPVSFFWLCVLFYFTGNGDGLFAEYLAEIVVISCIITPLGVWLTDTVAFVAKHRKQPFYFREYPAETATQLVITLVVLIGIRFIPSDVLPLIDSLLY